MECCQCVSWLTSNLLNIKNLANGNDTSICYTNEDENKIMNNIKQNYKFLHNTLLDRDRGCNRNDYSYINKKNNTFNSKYRYLHEYVTMVPIFPNAANTEAKKMFLEYFYIGEYKIHENHCNILKYEEEDLSTLDTESFFNKIKEIYDENKEKHERIKNFKLYY